MKQVCVAATNEGQVQIFQAHDPIQLPEQGSLQLNVSYQGDAVRVLFCKRCGVLYVDAHERVFEQPAQPSKPAPS